MAPGDVHQGILLEVDPLPSMALEDIVAKASDTATVVLLEVTDPHNVGAILPHLRSAAVFGADAIVMPQYHEQRYHSHLGQMRLWCLGACAHCDGGKFEASHGISQV